MKRTESEEVRQPWKISSYFYMEKWTLALITVTGIIYNVGMIAGPWFEGQLAQKLYDIMQGRQTFADMVRLAAAYAAVIFGVQLFRFFKRLYVRKFANHINRSMKRVIYRNLLGKDRKQLENEGIGNVMTKAVSDVDVCAEGMRKFTTEVFDTGVVMIAYIAMLLSYDWRLALISFLFPPLAYVIANRLKRVVSRTAAAYKESAGRLNAAALDRASNAVTYRVYGQEENQDRLFEDRLKDYEIRAIRSNIWENSMQPLYKIIAMISMFFILCLGARNVLQQGWTTWNIAAFTTFISCYTKLAVKSSRAAKLFNAVQKARVSWKRICPFMTETPEMPESELPVLRSLDLESLGVQYEKYLFRDLKLHAVPGQIIGVTGAVACGKSSLGGALLGELPFEGEIRINGEKAERSGAYYAFTGYMGHDPELLSDTIENNILLGKTGDVWPYLKMVRMDQEVCSMEEGVHTRIGSGGVRLSGGQQARIALARTLFGKKPVLVLDDPFSAVDKQTEREIFGELKKQAAGRVIFLISHRLEVFPELDQVIYMENGNVCVSDHASLMREQPGYAKLYDLQKRGDHSEK